MAALEREGVIGMFQVDVARKRVVIAHTVQALDGSVDLTTTFDLCNVTEEEMLLWAATNKLTRWLAGLETGRLPRGEVKKRFDNLVIECREYSQPDSRQVSQEETAIIDNLRKVLRDGVSMDELLQSLVRSTRHYGH